MILTPPANDELEISVFGPGVGESVLAHVGDGRWILVDSCVDRKGKAAATNYLRGIGVDPKDALSIIVVSHWHDDHIRGISQVVQESHNSKVCISAALRNQEFLTLAATTQRSMLKWPGASEMQGVLESLERRDNPALRVPLFAIEGRVLFDYVRNDGTRVVLRCLSPGDQVTKTSFQFFARMLSEGSPVRAVVDQDANTFCVALWLEVGTHKILLGSDLTPAGSGGVGWVAVVEHGASLGLHGAQVIKVPHHGAPNADNPTVWRDMLAAKPIGLVAPYSAGKTPRPTESDVKRLISRGASVFSTVEPRPLKPRPRTSSVEKTVNDVLKNRRIVVRDSGQIRVRAQPDGLVVDLFEGAVRLG